MTLVAPDTDLTNRELEVVRLLLAGVTSSAALCERLAITDNTLRYHLTSILRKTECCSRAQVVAWGYQAGLEPYS